MQLSRTSPHRIDKQVRADARWKIIQEVNKHLMRQRQPIFTRITVDHGHWRTQKHQRSEVVSHYRQPVLLSIRHLQRAVFIARRFKLVDDLTLQRAGFNVRH